MTSSFGADELCSLSNQEMDMWHCGVNWEPFLSSNNGFSFIHMIYDLALLRVIENPTKPDGEGSILAQLSV